MNVVIDDFDEPTEFALESVDNITCSKNIDALNLAELRKALFHWWTILKPNGALLFTITDMARVLGQCSLSDVFDLCQSTNRVWLSASNAVELLGEYGFEQFSVHEEPGARTHIKCRKVDLCTLDRWYAWDISIKDGESVLEVGPGNFPYKGATQYLDIDESFREGAGNKPFDIGTVEKLPYPDQSFDVVICAHVIEHTDNPDVALSELQRVGKRGYVEVPSAAKDWLMQHGHTHNRWQISQTGQTLVFVKLTSDKVRFLDDESERNQMARAIQYPGSDNYTQFSLRRTFWQSNQFLNCGAYWDANTKVKCVVIRE